MQSSFKTAFGASQAILDSLTKTLTDAMANPKGFDPKTLALMKTNASDTISRQVNAAQIAAGNSAATRGSPDLGSGVTAQISGSIAGEGMKELAGEDSNIDIQSGLLQNQNYWNAIQGLTGVAKAEDPTGFASAANQGSDATANLSKAVSSSKQADWQNTFGVISGIAGLGTAAVGAYKGLGFAGSSPGAGGGGV